MILSSKNRPAILSGAAAPLHFAFGGHFWSLALRAILTLHA